MQKIALLILCLFITACATPEQIAAQRAAQEQADVNTCLGYGFKMRSEAFSNCRLQLELSRQDRYNRAYRYGYGYYGPHTHLGYYHGF